MAGTFAIALSVKRITTLSAAGFRHGIQIAQSLGGTVEAIKGVGMMEGRSMLVRTMLVGFALVLWVYSWVVARSQRELPRGEEVAYA